MARVTGLEPATSGVTGRHSNQLSYTRAFHTPSMVRLSGLRDAPRQVKHPHKPYSKFIRIGIEPISKMSVG